MTQKQGHYDSKFHFVNEDGKVTTFARFMYARKGGGDIERIEDPDGGPASYRVRDASTGR